MVARGGGWFPSGGKVHEADGGLEGLHYASERLPTPTSSFDARGNVRGFPGIFEGAGIYGGKGISSAHRLSIL